MDALLFLYPEKKNIRIQIERGAYALHNPQRDAYWQGRFAHARHEKERRIVRAQALAEAQDEFRPLYGKALNQSIDVRYRTKSFRVFYALLKDDEISPLIDVNPEDRIIRSSLDRKTHQVRLPDGTYPNYPDLDELLRQVPASKLVVCGFHFGDCVHKTARHAKLRGIETYIDAGLTDLMYSEILKPDFFVEKTTLLPV